MTVPRVLQEAIAIVDAYDEAHPETAPTRPRVATKWPSLRNTKQRYCYCGHLLSHHDPHGCRIMVNAHQTCPCEDFNENTLDEFPDME